MKDNAMLNQWQKTAIAAYADGEFLYLEQETTKQAFYQQLDGCGDSLLTFLMLELSTTEDCEDKETALKRMRAAFGQIIDVIAALEQLPAPNPETYRVTWEIDITATTPDEAAEIARRIQRDRTSTATTFVVRRQNTHETQTVNLS